jgi:hypothetical protein
MVAERNVATLSWTFQTASAEPNRGAYGASRHHPLLQTFMRGFAASWLPCLPFAVAWTMAS